MINEYKIPIFYYNDYIGTYLLFEKYNQWIKIVDIGYKILLLLGLFVR